MTEFQTASCTLHEGATPSPEPITALPVHETDNVSLTVRGTCRLNTETSACV